MTEIRRHNWLIRYYRAQFGLYLRLLAGPRLLPPPVAAAGLRWLRRTAVPKRGI
ncbi:hypothetical protein [Kribbella sp. CA-293567]|uniref:hypothetical protein n=1 Tax=Kribbella sp. CA-293567 TaxID=3002436 RepID=UPI0022DD681C|nr:hypothetical protein [Kribbella sp. CA-293567]WBQ04408.1 hypothetical protein OX958_31150 [Kribbella sp. CA-293567]